LNKNCLKKKDGMGGVWREGLKCWDTEFCAPVNIPPQGGGKTPSNSGRRAGEGGRER